jgi:hypothetical protein
MPADLNVTYFRDRRFTGRNPAMDGSSAQVSWMPPSSPHGANLAARVVYFGIRLLRCVLGSSLVMRPAISTTALITILMGTGILVFNALGLSISVGDFAQTKPATDVVIRGLHGTMVHTYFLELWTPSEREWMTIGCLLIVGGRLFDARFLRH